MTTQLWIHGADGMIRSDQIVKIEFERLENPVRKLVKLKTATDETLFCSFDEDEYDQAGPIVDKLIKMIAGYERDNTACVLMAHRGDVIPTDLRDT